MKTILHTLVALALLAILPAYGQKEKNVVYQVSIGELIYTPPTGESTNAVGQILKGVAETMLTGQSSKQEPQYAEAVRAGIVNGLNRVVLFRPMEGGMLDADGLTNVPALYVDGTIANISTVSKVETVTDKNGKKKGTETHYRGLITVTVNLKEVSNGSIINSHTFNIDNTGGAWMGSSEKAISNALEYLASQVGSYYNKLFPLHASIVEGGEVKKNKQKEVYIDLGFPDGVYEGQSFDVYLVKTVAGKEARTLIGRLRIEEVQGDEISLCKVTKGGDKIKTAVDEGQTLLITSR
ncbi:hypothetical protein [Parabacteroides sp.]|uniref:hypothetical protein n=1 Tax=Parabacteroides sp. TaxID=1869337 RepID=UPI00257DB31F|nr:hypothetical protein [Parabacteroides sp.]